MPKALLIAACLMATHALALANTCEDLRTQIEAKIKANGVTDFTVTVVSAPAPAGARVVGHCGQGSKHIIYRPGPSGAVPALAASAAAQAPANANSKLPAASMLTECKDGRVVVDGDCKK